MSDRDSFLFALGFLSNFFDDDEQEMLDFQDSNQRIDILSCLPREVAVLVLELLPVEDFCRVQHVCRTWYELCQHPVTQLKIQKYRRELQLRKENVPGPSDRLHRRLSTGMINRQLDSPFAALQLASPTPEETCSGQRRSLESPGVRFVDDYRHSCTTEQSMQLVRPKPVRLFTRPWTPTQDDFNSSSPVGSKASKRRLKRF